jgi:2-keto-4-pentenoate hydratase/2-oxohepta-3-ene-1,7-dioic acid hydratase in catechol pathway
MKLVRFGKCGSERPGLIDESGRLRDLSAVVPDVATSALSPASLRAIAASEGLPVVHEAVRFGACVGQVGKMICVGLNYHEHVREVGSVTPKEPILFMKATSAICGPDDQIILPPQAQAVDWEVELGVVIGTRATRVTLDRALDHVAGYCIVNDVSERDWQLQGTGQWVKGKSSDTFGPLGPWLVTADEIPDPQQLRLTLGLNGEQRQSGTTADMVFGVREIVSYISRFMTLLPGDVISTGTPPGVGMGCKPPRYLRDGDRLELSIEGLGVQRQRCVASA